MSISKYTRQRASYMRNQLQLQVLIFKAIPALKSTGFLFGYCLKMMKNVLNEQTSSEHIMSRFKGEEAETSEWLRNFTNFQNFYPMRKRQNILMGNCCSFNEPFKNHPNIRSHNQRISCTKFVLRFK